MFFCNGFFLGMQGSGGGSPSTGGSGGIKWKFESLAGTRGVTVSSITVPDYDMINDKIMVSIGGIEMGTSDFTKINSTIIGLPDTALNDEDIEIWNFGVTGFTKQTKLNITGHINSGTVFSAVSSGVNYVKTGQSPDLSSDATGFNTSATIQVFLNGAVQEKGIEVAWLSSTSFTLNKDLDNGDWISILS